MTDADRPQAKPDTRPDTQPSGSSWGPKLVVLAAAAMIVVVIAALAWRSMGGSSTADQAQQQPASVEQEPASPESATSDSAAAPAQAPAPRVAALLPFAADQLIALGVRPVLVPALPTGQPEAWQGIEAGALDHSVGPNIEQLIAADPDLVVMSAVYSQFATQIETTTGASVKTMDADTLADVAAHTRTLGDLVGKPEQAERWIQGFNDRLAQAETIDSAGNPASVLAVFGTPSAFYAFLPDSYLGDLVDTAGGRLITADMPAHRFFRGLSPLSMEAVVQKDPDVILVVFHGPERAARAMFDRDPLWGQLTAIKEDRIAFLANDLYAMRAGSQPALALQNVRAAIQSAREAQPKTQTESK
jgi:iron complex transport system substrate-binding protein